MTRTLSAHVLATCLAVLLALSSLGCGGRERPPVAADAAADASRGSAHAAPSADAAALADAIGKIRLQGASCTGGSSRSVETIAVMLKTGAVKVWPSTGAAVDIAAPVHVEYSSETDVLTVRALVDADSKSRSKRNFRFFRPVRWEEIAEPGTSIVRD